jgi:hypothetical protein
MRKSKSQSLGIQKAIREKGPEKKSGINLCESSAAVIAEFSMIKKSLCIAQIITNQHKALERQKTR